MQWMLDPDGDGNPNTGDAHVPDVVNNSWGWPGSSAFFWNAVNNWVAADIFPVFIAHNDGPNPSTVRVPGSYPQSFCVGAVDDNDVVQNFSGRGPVTWSESTYIKPDVVAPSGPAIKFCVPTDQTFWQQNFPSGYHTFSGKTSTSGPHVTGYSNSQYVNSWQVPKAHDEDTETTEVLPVRIRLHPNYPNPFNPATEIRLELPQPSEVTFTIFSTNGKEVRTLHQRPLVAGYHTFSWDGKDGHGRQLASGTYFYRFEAITAEAGQSTFVKVGKMTLLR